MRAATPAAVQRLLSAIAKGSLPCRPHDRTYRQWRRFSENRGADEKPRYVYNVTSIYKRLIDERRDATESEIRFLSDVFSRSGFTDAYFTGDVYKSPHLMLGTRTEADKLATARAEMVSLRRRSRKKLRLPKCRSFYGIGEKSLFTLKTAFGAASVAGDVPEAAKIGRLRLNMR